MEILRVAENITDSGIEVTITVPGSQSESDHTILVTDLSDLSISETSVSTAGGQELTIFLNDRYDASYLIELIFDGIVIFEEQYDIVRPYINPNSMGTTATEISDYAKSEELARAIIDTVVDEGFYFEKKSIELQGLGADYLPIWDNVKKILKVYENNVLVYDSSAPEDYSARFELTRNRSAITVSYSGLINRNESAQIYLPAAESDIIDTKYSYRGFPKSFDYSFIVESGYYTVPSDIEKAAELLIDDIRCGKLEYYKRYVSDYNTDQFKIKFNDLVFEGTGNVLVDKILSKYVKSIRKIGVL